MNKEDILSLLELADVRLKHTEVDYHKPLTHQGLDSLDMTNLLFQIENRYDLTISAEEASKLRTVENLVDYVRARAAPK
ncbi:acyl carrier protein [Haliangium ochraceum]|uniref:Phosphopantetheine-binding protein n=1 Tax=Haliangium ochraceum (strain DSM 14365 / JCM 11303 / SMP-2) TaxID=502025 RepID=D0LPU6_HALO1|nr:acyl carrier protein [Haliangium ochraceum]ACY15459.1 phosphopantetheine-binding protein [Haliangium ochraceum DSM 14365]